MHDPLCPNRRLLLDICPMCQLIARVRVDERARWQPKTPIQRGHAALCWCRECMGTAVGPA